MAKKKTSLQDLKQKYERAKKEVEKATKIRDEAIKKVDSLQIAEKEAEVTYVNQLLAETGTSVAFLEELLSPSQKGGDS